MSIERKDIKVRSLEALQHYEGIRGRTSKDTEKK